MTSADWGGANDGCCSYGRARPSIQSDKRCRGRAAEKLLIANRKWMSPGCDGFLLEGQKLPDSIIHLSLPRIQKSPGQASLRDSSNEQETMVPPLLRRAAAGRASASLGSTFQRHRRDFPCRSELRFLPNREAPLRFLRSSSEPPGSDFESHSPSGANHPHSCDVTDTHTHTHSSGV